MADLRGPRTRRQNQAANPAFWFGFHLFPAVPSPSAALFSGGESGRQPDRTLCRPRSQIDRLTGTRRPFLFDAGRPGTFPTPSSSIRYSPPHIRLDPPAPVPNHRRPRAARWPPRPFTLRHLIFNFHAPADRPRNPECFSPPAKAGPRRIQADCRGRSCPNWSFEPGGNWKARCRTCVTTPEAAFGCGFSPGT